MVATRAEQQPQGQASKSGKGAKYRDQPDGYGYPSNIMFDRRVVRGNTYAAQILAAEPHILDSSAKKTTRGKKATQRVVLATPEPVEGRRHTDIQTDAYLEELTDVVPETEISTQTDPFMDRPPTPLFVPQKRGMDATTQIEPGDLFDFNFEVEPILEVLVGKTLEQGYMEVLEEEELAEMRAHQEHFEQIRNAELVATQRMEAAEIRKMEEKERRLAQERERLERERVVREKVAASTFARGYLNGIVTTVFDRLERKGFFYDPVEREVENVFMPWLKDETLKKIRNDILMRQLVVSLVKEAKDLREAQIREAQEKEERQRKALEEHAAREAAAMAKLQEDIREGIERKASLILRELPEPVAPPEVVDGVRSELQAKAEEACTAAWEEAKAKVLEEAKAEFRSGKEEEEIDEAEEEAFVAAAVEAVPKPEAQGITDRDVLSAMLESGAVSKDGIVHGLAIYYLAEAEGKLVPQDPTEEEDKKE